MKLGFVSSPAKGASLWRRAVILTAALPLAGCIPTAVVPNPALDVPAAYKFGGGGKDAPPPKVDWWTAFRSTELDGVMKQTAASNFDVAVAVAQIKEADAASRVAGAALLPTLSASDSVTKSRESSASLGGSGTGGVNVGGGAPTLYSSVFNASYVVDLWGKNRAAFEASVATANYSRFNRDTVELTSISSAATTYFAILGARERVGYARQDIKAATDILKLIKDQQKYGTASDLNVAQQEALVDNLVASIPPLQEMADQNVAALALLLGEPPKRLTIKATSFSGLHYPRISPGLPSQILLQRPDVQSAEAQLISAHASLISARAAFFPQIQLTGEGGFESLALKSLFSPQAGLYSLSAGLTQPIFDGGALLGTFEQQKGMQDQLLASYRKSVVSAFTDVEKGIVGLQQSAAEEKALEKSYASSKRAYDLSLQQLKYGTINYVTLLQAEQTLFTTLDSLSQARLAHYQAAVTLYQSLGGGIPWRRQDDHLLSATGQKS